MARSCPAYAYAISFYDTRILINYTYRSLKPFIRQNAADKIVKIIKFYMFRVMDEVGTIFNYFVIYVIVVLMATPTFIGFV